MGFIGSHTAVELINKGYQTIIADDLSNSQESVLDGIEKITGVRPAFERTDLKDKTAVREIFDKYEIDAVIHFAAYKAVGESVHKPLLYYRNNLVSLLNILDCLTENSRGGNLVFSSSCTVYGQPDRLPVTEDSPIKPAESPYGNTKQISEEIIRDAVNAHELLKAVSLRYFNPIGAHPSAEIGELPRGVPQNLIPYITQTAMGIRESLSVFGGDYDTPDGTGVRDYIHVVDLALGHLKAIDYSMAHTGVEAINLGTGRGTSVLEIVHAFEKACGHEIPYQIVGRRAGDIATCYADASKAKELLGWEATRGIEEMCRSSWNFIQKNPNGLQ